MLSVVFYGSAVLTLGLMASGIITAAVVGPMQGLPLMMFGQTFILPMFVCVAIHKSRSRQEKP